MAYRHHHPSRAHRVFVALLLCTMLLGQLFPMSALAAPSSQLIRPPQDPAAGGLIMDLSDGSAQQDATDLPPTAASRPLGVAETQAVLDRLPPLEMEAGDVVDFRLPSQSPPPPRTGDTVQETFPPTTTVTAPAVDTEGPLEVLRYAPEGEIPLAPFLNVTFNQPMAPLATVEQLAAADVPVVLEPALPGTWKWLGTQTLSFAYQSEDVDRFPMATEFTVTVPAGTTSMTGGVLAEDVIWSFRTPPPRVVNQYPSYGAQPPDPILFIEFDQRISPADMIYFVAVSAKGTPFDVRLATAAEIAADETIARLVAAAPEDRWLALRPVTELPLDTTINVAIMRGAPSAEGPRLTTETQSFSFQTYAPLRIVEHRCSYYDQRCPPLTPFMIRFNNPLDPARFDPAHFTAEPDIPGLFANNYGDTVELSGATAGRTTYKVTVSGQVTDIFGQTLGQDAVISFQTGEANKLLRGPDRFVTLDPAAGRPLFTVYSVNIDQLRVRAYAVTPDDWRQYQELQSNYRYDRQMPDPPGTEVWSDRITVQGEPDQLTETAIDLSPALNGVPGQLIVVVDAPSLLNLLPLNYDIQRVVAWTQVTRIGLDAYADHASMVAWATDLRDGTPLTGVELSLQGTQVAGVTDDDGIAELALQPQGSPLLVGRLGNDLALLPASSYYWDDNAWAARPLRDELRWYIFDDRAMYRPGETVHVKGWLRQIGGGPAGDVGLPAASGLTVRYQVVDPFGNELATDLVPITALTGFDLSFALPENANLGYATIYLTAQGIGDVDGGMTAHGFQIQEFRRPEFEVTANVETAGPHFLGDSATVAVNAAYFAGGPLPNAEANWTVDATPGDYAPPNWPDFVFGKWRPWWAYWERGFDGGSRVETFTGHTDATGAHYLDIAFQASDEPQPYNVTASAAVMDVNRQVWSASTTLLVHPATLYVGLRSERTFVEQGDPLEIDAIVPDVDGTAIAGVAIAMQAARLEWEFKQGEWQEVEVDVQECAVQSTLEPVHCTFTTDIGGEYRIRATVTDDQDRANRTEFTRWVSGGSQPPARNVEQETVQLIPDKESYQPGDEAEILVRAPFAPAHGLLTVSRGGFVYTEPFVMDAASTVLRIPIEDAHTPSLNVQVDLNGSAPRTDGAGEVQPDLPARPAYATGSLQLSIPPISRELAVDVTPAALALEPGGSAVIDVQLTDAAGAPVADSEVAIVVVDEAILALTGYELLDPLEIFYQPIYGGVSSTYGRGAIVLDNPLELAEQMLAREEGAVMAAAMPTALAPGAAPNAFGDAAMDMAMAEAPAMEMAAGGGQDKANGAPIALRSNFDPLALFAPAERTGADGRVRVEFDLPDNLTRYRIMAVAVADGKYFGTGEANLTARLPLMVRPSAPRFLNFGDRFELPVVLQNQTDGPLTVDVAVEVGNLHLTDTAGQRVEVPANDRVEVRFPAETVNAGTARLRIAAVAGDYADAAAAELPVYTPATTEAFATYGVVDADLADGGAVVQPLATPRDVFPQFGGLEIGTSSTALQALTDAVIYLNDYPFECSEQLASRVLGIAALRDVLTAFDASGLPEPAELEAAVQRDITTLQGLQNEDGGFPIWRRGYESEPFYTIHVAHALQRAADKGFQVPADTQSRVLDYLRAIDRHIPGWYGITSRHMLASYAVYVRDLMGDVDTAEAHRLYTRMPLEEQSLEAVAWIWQVLSGDPAYAAEVAEIRRLVNNQAVETAGAANFTTGYGDDAYLLLHSDRRTDALILDALINDQPDSDLIPKVVNGLLAHQTRGRWDNTQENVFVLLALDRYFNTFEAVTPDFVARVWLGDTYVAEHEFRGRTTARRETILPMAYLTASEEDLLDLILGKEGDGRLYYRLGLRYAPDDLVLEPLDMGFVVQRSYTAVDDPGDVTRDVDGTWYIKAGARVKVELQMVAQNRRYHVALVDPLPAGLEIINPALAVSEPLPGGDPGRPEPYDWWWYGPWYQHQNLRDQRAEAFTTLLWDGVYDYSYIARATTPGTFVVPPAKAEEMYSPEVFGRSGSDRVIVE